MSIELEDGTIVRSLPEQVSKNLEDIIDLANRLAALKQQVEIGLSAALHYKGSVATYSDLPTTGNEIGDLWNVLDTGNNYAWTGSVWDEIGSSVDLSNYAQLSGLANHFTNENNFNGDVNFSGASQRVVFGEQTAVLSNNGYDFGEQDSQVASISHSGAYEEFTFYDVNSGHSVIFDFANEKIYTTATSMDLGDSTHQYKDLYLSGKVILGTKQVLSLDSSNRLNLLYDGNTKIKVGNSDTYFVNNVSPDSNNTYELGSSSLKWKNIYIGSTIYLGTNSKIDISGNNITIDAYGSGGYVYSKSTILPSYDNQRDLGSSTYRWKDLFLSGSISDGTNSATATEIAALVAYAKAQGWIS